MHVSRNVVYAAVAVFLACLQRCSFGSSLATSASSLQNRADALDAEARRIKSTLGLAP